LSVFSTVCNLLIVVLTCSVFYSALTQNKETGQGKLEYQLVLEGSNEEELAMPWKGHTEEQIIAALQQAEVRPRPANYAGSSVLARQHFMPGRSSITGLGVQELRELRQLREENGRLKRIVADLTLDRQILQEIVSKKL
jgi:putative transposase